MLACHMHTERTLPTLRAPHLQARCCEVPCIRHAHQLPHHQPAVLSAMHRDAAACSGALLPTACPAEIQTLASSLSTSALHGQRPVLGVLLAYDQYVLWSTHSMEDSAALWRLASSALLPQAKSSRWQVHARWPWHSSS